MSERLGDWYIYCDICGRKCLASKATKLPTYTGRGGLIVCPQDVDSIDPGVVPYKIPVEKNIPWTRINHTNTDDAAPFIDYETMSFEVYLADSQDNAVITDSQDDAYIVSTGTV